MVGQPTVTLSFEKKRAIKLIDLDFCIPRDALKAMGRIFRMEPDSSSDHKSIRWQSGAIALSLFFINNKIWSLTGEKHESFGVNDERSARALHDVLFERDTTWV